MIFHDLGVPKTRLKSISKSMPKTNRYWTLSEPYFGYMASRAAKMVPRRPREPPRRLLYAARAVPAPPKTPLRLPKTPPRLSKSLQDGSVSLQELSRRGFLRAQAVSKSSLEELPKPPAFARCLQERFDSQDSKLLRFLGAL